MRKIIILITLFFFTLSNGAVQAQPNDELSDTSRIVDSLKRLNIDRQIEYIKSLTDVEDKIKEELIALSVRYKKNVTQEEETRLLDLLAKLSPEDCLGYYDIGLSYMDEFAKHPEIRQEIIQRIKADSQLSQEDKDEFIAYIESGKPLKEYLGLEFKMPEGIELPKELHIDFSIDPYGDMLAMLTFVTQVARWNKMTNVTNEDIEAHLNNIKPSARTYQGIAELYLTRKIKGSEDNWRERAVEYYKKAQVLDADNPSIYLSLVTTYFLEFKNYQDEIPKALKEARKIDNQNAVYDYLLAYYYFTIDREELALSHIEAGSKKSHINTYQVDGFKAAIEVSKELGIDSITAKVLIGDMLGPLKGFDLLHLIKDMRDTASAREEEERWQEARDIYNYLIRLSEQATESRPSLLAKLLNVDCQIYGYSGLAHYYNETNQTKKAGQMKEKAQLAEAEKDSMKRGRYSTLGGPLFGLAQIYIELGKEGFEKFIDERFFEGRDGEYLMEVGRVDTFEELMQMIREKFLY
jgi:tetratricopeptide (TPR) repeat protein